MSGICGMVDFAAPRIDPENLRNMAESSSYRAPGGIGYLFLNEAGLAFQALQAPAAGAGLDQPLLEPRHQVCLVMDGRLDNRSDLVDWLGPAEGTAASDAGLLLAAYLEWGVECTDHLLGDFAFAVWDAPRKRLFCAVDPLGIKPFHYARAGSLLCFASDAVQVLRHPEVPAGYDEGEIAAYLECQAEDPERSFFAAIHKLGPARRLIVENGNLHVERYWSPDPAEIRYPRDEDYEDRFRELFQRSVADRLRGCGKLVGISMSGGLDSTSVAACAQRVPGSSVRAYTYVFDRLAECDEQSYSRAVTEELGLEVEPVAVEALWKMESQNELPLSADTPFTGWRSCTAEIFRRMARAGSRVLLTGHGGDDLMRGSSLVYAERLRRGDLGAVREVLRHARSQRSSGVRSLYRHFGRPHLSAGAERGLRRALGIGQEELSQPWLDPDFARRARRAGRRQPAGAGASPSRQAIHAKLVGTPWYWRLANWHDRNSASFGIEVRHPFLDRRLVEYVLALPGEQLFRLGSSKNLLRRAMRGILPERIRLRADKTRFTSFIDFVLLERSAGEIVELLREPRSANLGILDGDALRSAYLSLVHGGLDAPRRAVWYAINLEIWLRRCEAVIHSRHLGMRAGDRAAA
ncbi:MAG TPA: asparagine synthase-related protein [Thermoanaerobaculia bacterium]|jgi:asparagine synthase (glutamine-hydrolysing)|nr:asparagine synthase-related protein [Thermoanaerobaculia bacterium]